MTTAPTEPELIRRAIESRLGDLFTFDVAHIQVYDSAKQVADVIPQIRRPMPTEEDLIVHEDLPVVPNVPVLFMRGGGFSITWPLNPGDAGLLLTFKYSIAQWRRSGVVSDPGDLRLHSLGNCAFFPCIGSNLQALAHGSDSGMVLEGPSIKLGAGAIDPLANGEGTALWLEAIKIALGSAGFPPTPPPGFPLTSDVKCTKAKGE